MDNDLIRRSDALKELCDRSTPAFTTLGKPTFKVDYIDAINDVPAVDAVEVVHAYWVEDDECVYCSNCGADHNWIDYRATYCEDCGARMDGQRREDGGGENVRGEWQFDGDDWFCNKCNHNALCDKDTGEQVLSVVCPNCGADMRGRDDG